MKNSVKLLLICCVFLNATSVLSTSYKTNESKPKTLYYIATDGKDGNDGSIHHPWSSLKYALSQVKGGETIFFRAGTYRIEVEFKKFKTKNGAPISIEAYPNEKVVFDGTRRLDANWKLWKNGIYRTIVKQSFWQLFVDQELGDMARWPNTSFQNDSIWRMTQSMRSIDGGFRKGKYTGKSRFGLVYDKDFKTSKKEKPTLSDNTNIR